ncbi:MAG: SGNH/GDSL hydrolase family protein, partial [Thermoleophilaceae bacterium]|nr:SGNH/GDSL hydrolase family protein [Thermoleophilaceae bacterium]
MASRRRLQSTLLTVLSVAVIAMIALCVPAFASATSGRYVALGDSFTAGSGVLPVETETPIFCARSLINYPHLAQIELDYDSFADVSCGAAQTKDMLGVQTVFGGAKHQPQFNALTADTRLVTLGIGGNDIGFLPLGLSCLTLSPFGSPCKHNYVKNGVDEVEQRITATEPKIVATVQGIHERSPLAKVFVVGYQRIVNPTGIGCWPKLPIAYGDAPWLDGIERHLNAMIKRVAESNGATYVDVYTPSIGHDACKTPNVRWVEPLSFINNYTPLHPNAAGEAAMERAL